VPVRRSSGTFARVGVMAVGDAAVFFSRMLARMRDRWGLVMPETASPRRKMLQLGSVRRSYADRVLAVGDAAGLVKPTTGGGIYYSVVSGEIAAEVLGSRLRSGELSAMSLREYERRWRSRFQSEFTAQLALRFVAQKMRDADIDALFTLATTDGILPLVRQTARFNRHREFILALLKHPRPPGPLPAWPNRDGISSAAARLQRVIQSPTAVEQPTLDEIAVAKSPAASPPMQAVPDRSRPARQPASAGASLPPVSCSVIAPRATETRVCGRREGCGRSAGQARR
jgi:hypothetical protein